MYREPPVLLTTGEVIPIKAAVRNIKCDDKECTNNDLCKPTNEMI